ncbi:DUF305 domain-containing protein [Emticicia sp. BO119]|uniref:DUF305 domain-containing protein n=1 Tax=Emticicia sp. BO119 TaxID=2757768 RepID=UPI0015F0F8C4|nr:DUF305 domain-containing protein [Emticicia sp. BO119]MBA4853431.1 DUF305 domain-containing protein [Emticicia sp. BO119]
MKILFKILTVCIVLIASSSCKKDNDLIEVQQHDDNQMMGIMHEMMNKMDQMMMTKDPDVDFAMMMKVHHQGAIEMAKFELQDGSDNQIKDLAQNLIAEQENEIKELENFLSKNNPKANNPEFTSKMMEIMDKMDRNADLQIINGKVDEDFSTLMIGHHQSAIEMANLEVLNGTDGQLKILAASIVKAQQKEIKDFQVWLLNNRN